MERVRSSMSSFRLTVSLIGPAFVAAIAYVDPGNFATNLSAGSEYKYLLLWVLILANAMASIVQYLSAKIGVITGKSLPEIVRDKLPRKARISYWLQAEVVAVSTDIAEVLGGSIALNLLFDIPLLLGGAITGVVSLILLSIQNKHGQKVFERVIIGMLLIIPIGFIAGLIAKPPIVGEVVGGLLPRFSGTDSLLLASGMIGATVMPHVVYLHSALTRDRHGKVPGSHAGKLLKATRIDVAIAMIIAGSINITMLLVAASAFFGSDLPGLDTIEGIHAAASTLISPTFATLFGISLLVSGFASTAVGCYAGAVIMDGLLQRKIPLLLRRLCTLIPALIILALEVDPTFALVLSQVVLSFGIPFAILPLILATSKRSIMGEHVNRKATNIAAWAIAGLIVILNCLLIILTLRSFIT